MDVGALHDAAELSPRFRAEPTSPPAASGGPSSIAELQTDDPAALAPFVAANEPCVLRGALRSWKPVMLWRDEHLRGACGERRVPVRVAHAPGRFGDPSRSGMYAADSPSLPLSELLDALSAAEAAAEASRVYAAQIRLRTFLPELYADTRPEPNCLGALGPLWRNSPSAYMGCGAATSLHFDLLENLLVVVAGRKQVSLWHPAHSALLYPGGGDSALFSRVADPHDTASAEFPLLRTAAPLALHAELNAGDALYLPTCWWHHVRSREGERSLSVSYWASQPAPKAWRRPREEWKAEGGAGGGEGGEGEGDKGQHVTSSFSLR